MSMMQEAFLYGDLVLYLRNRWVEELASLSSNLDLMRRVEGARIDELVRRWFFMSQDDGLYGSTPRDIIRREERGKPNVVPLEHEHKMFFDDCPLCEAMKNGELDLGEMHWTYCPDMTLLDQFDPEGYDAKYADPDDTMDETSNNSDD